MVTSSFDGETPPTGTVVDDQTYAPFHQHFIVARMDMEIDGPENTVVVSESEALPDLRTPTPTAWRWCSAAGRCSPSPRASRTSTGRSQRGWKVVNRDHLNRLGSADRLQAGRLGVLPGAGATADSPILQRAGVIDHTAVGHAVRRGGAVAGRRVLQPEPRRRRPAGVDGADRSIADTDIVLWHVFGIHHIPRPEDWPVMPVDIVSFSLKPWGFFDRNPALDVPPVAAHCSPGCTLRALQLRRGAQSAGPTGGSGRRVPQA